MYSGSGYVRRTPFSTLAAPVLVSFASLAGFPDYVMCVTAPDSFAPHILCQDIGNPWCERPMNVKIWLPKQEVRPTFPPSE